MPLFYQHTINETASLAVWHITEEEDFFLKKVHLKKHISHPHKRLQHLAGRYLLQLLHSEFPLQLIEIAASNKPVLPAGTIHFSISHCGNFAAAIFNKNKSAGIDVELVTPKIELIKNKFLSDNELRLIDASDNSFISHLTILWSCKEAIYKWYGKGSVDFKKNIIIEKIIAEKDSGTVYFLFTKETEIKLSVTYLLFKNLCLAWVTG